MTDTKIHYLAEYQDGSAVRDDDTPGGTWWVAGDIYGYATLPDAHAALALLSARGKQVTNTRVWRVTTTQELV